MAKPTFAAYWHFVQLKKFGDIPVMDAFWDENATIAGLQIPQKDRSEVAKFILEDLDKAKDLLFDRSKYAGLRISKEAAMMLAMQVALYEGSWEKVSQKSMPLQPIRTNPSTSSMKCCVGRYVA